MTIILNYLYYFHPFKKLHILMTYYRIFRKKYCNNLTIYCIRINIKTCCFPININRSTPKINRNLVYKCKISNMLC